MLRISFVLLALLTVVALASVPESAPAEPGPLQFPAPEIVPGTSVRVFSSVAGVAGDYRVREVRGSYARILPIEGKSKATIWFNFATIEGYQLIR